jgi:anti-sigma factor ChrR (cupin superfamily)
MDLNADFSRRAVVHAGRQEWSPSPIAGVDRRMLDRVGDEVARATSIVRYAPASSFSEHIHGGGEEIFVIEGVLSDDEGDYPLGTYIRNPPGSRHAPRSMTGCVIFVKLWQFADGDHLHVKADTLPHAWQEVSNRPGVEVMPLFQHRAENVTLERWAHGREIELPAPAGIELLVLSGGFHEGGEPFMLQSWLRLPPGSSFQGRVGETGCVVWMKSGHLSPPIGLHKPD